MKPTWRRKRCSRRFLSCPPPICTPRPRPCLDSLQIPPLRPCALHRKSRTEFIPKCIRPSSDIKHPICHCSDKNYCTAETCINSRSCIQSKNLFCPYGINGGKDEDVFNGPYRQQVGGQRDYIEDYEKDIPACDEASCEQQINCGVGSTSYDEEINNPITYTPSVSQYTSSITPPDVPSRQLPFKNDSDRRTNNINDPSLSDIGFTGRTMAANSNKMNGINKVSNVNRCIQINMQNETISRTARDAESSVSPEGCCSGNEVPNANNVDQISQPASNTKSTSDTGTERYDTNVQKYNQSSKTLQSHSNTHFSNVDDIVGYSRDNEIAVNNGNDSNTNKPSINACCKYSYDRPDTYDSKSEEQLYREIGDDSKRSKESSQQSGNISSELEKNSKRELAPQSSHSKNISKNQFISSNHNDCCINGSFKNKLDSLESIRFKSAPLTSSSVANIQPIRSHTKPSLVSNTSMQFTGSQLNQVRFHDNKNTNKTTYSSPIENQKLKYNALPSSSKIQINDNNSKDTNYKMQPTDSVFSDQKYDKICEGCRHGCCSQGESRIYKPVTDKNCLCHDNVKLTKTMECKKKPACVIEDGTTTCASTTCVVNQNLGCKCRYPPAFKQFSCTGNISGICDCNNKK